MDPNQTAPSPAPAEPVATPSPSPDDALRSIASELTVEEQAKTFTATPTPAYQPQFQPQQFYAPDPVTDSEGYKRYMAEQHQTGTQIRSALDTVLSEVQSFKQTFQQQKVNADVDRAVQVVNAKVKADPEVVEAMLNVEYTKNPTFKKIFDNRERNPIAFEKALGVIADKFAPKFQVRTDPQLVENVRAARSSQQTMATTKQISQNEEVGNMTDLEFQRWWQSQRQG